MKKKFFLCEVLKNFVFLQPLFSDGALAQLARAFDWQSRGREFDSHTLHKFFLFSIPTLFLKIERFFSNSPKNQ